MPQLVLTLCAALVLFLLRIEWRAARYTSKALWIPTVWMLIIASRPPSTWLVVAARGTENNDSGSVLDRLVLSVLAAATLIVLGRRHFSWWPLARRHKSLLVLLVYMFLSTLWSDITQIAMKRWIRELIVVLMALAVISEANPRHALESVLRRTAYVLLPFSLVLIKYYPILGVQYSRWSGTLMWVGVTNQKNHLGRLCMISILFLSFAVYRRWRDGSTRKADRHQGWVDLFIICLALFLLHGSDSSTSITTLIFGVVIVGGLQMLRRLKLKVPQFGFICLVILLMAFGISTPFLGGSNVAGLTSSLGRDETLTGRTKVWADVMPARAKQPLLGYGLGSFWTDARRKFYDIPTSHNGYLDIMLEFGEVGLFWYAVLILSCARQLRNALVRDYDWASIGIAFLLMSLLYNTTESALNSLSDHVTAVSLLATFVLSDQWTCRGNRRNSPPPIPSIPCDTKNEFIDIQLIEDENWSAVHGPFLAAKPRASG